MWAAAWLYKATGDNAYLSKARSLTVNKDVSEFSWDEKTIGAHILMAQLTQEQPYVNKAVSFCNKMADTQTKTPKGLVWIQQWGPLRHSSNVALACLEAAEIDHSSVNADKYRSFAMKQIHYGVNLTKSAKSQALDVIKKLKVTMPIAQVWTSNQAENKYDSWQYTKGDKNS